MTATVAESGQGERDVSVAGMRDTDQSAFSAIVEQHRHELRVHCYRMLGSFEDAEDLVQETYLRAWRGRETFQGRSTLRAWLYRIATNACLDFLAHNERRIALITGVASEPREPTPPPHIPWLQPYPDALLDIAAPIGTEADSAVVAKETIELAFLVAIQFLPPKQRAVLILRDVLEWSAKETAELLDDTVPAVNGALQRARATMQKHHSRNLEGAARVTPSEEELEVLQRYIKATQDGDMNAIAAVLREDLRFSMPPEPGTYASRQTVLDLWASCVHDSSVPPFAAFRCVITRANRMPAIACYAKRSGDDVDFLPLTLDVVRIEDGLIAEITAFALEPVREALGLPATL